MKNKFQVQIAKAWSFRNVSQDDEKFNKASSFVEFHTLRLMEIRKTSFLCHPIVSKNKTTSLSKLKLNLSHHRDLTRLHKNQVDREGFTCKTNKSNFIVRVNTRSNFMVIKFYLVDANTTNNIHIFPVLPNLPVLYHATSNILYSYHGHETPIIYKYAKPPKYSIQLKNLKTQRGNSAIPNVTTVKSSDTHKTIIITICDAPKNNSSRHPIPKFSVEDVEADSSLNPKELWGQIFFLNDSQECISIRRHSAKILARKLSRA
ncbi:Uncharacterized protein FWK35_00019213 [Aphis craccivora]|uniref:Uncharacterized protein n=1 Tax=Aphis craccivora TaxID=307492 RepID=A0A6G0YFJ6_APHCR|nr:Uncharacterized protein FWK35_00019213 [Aphis craccivora]